MLDINELFKIICLLLFMTGFDFKNYKQLEKFEIAIVFY